MEASRATLRYHLLLRQWGGQLDSSRIFHLATCTCRCQSYQASHRCRHRCCLCHWLAPLHWRRLQGLPPLGQEWLLFQQLQQHLLRWQVLEGNG